MSEPLSEKQKRLIHEAGERHRKRYADTHAVLMEVLKPIIDTPDMSKATEEDITTILAIVQIADACMPDLLRTLASSALVRLASIKLQEEEVAKSN